MLINIHELAVILHRSPETIRKDLGRNPSAVPPRVVMPGTRLLRWHLAIVDTWLRAHVEGGTK